MGKRRFSRYDSNPGCSVEAAISLIDGKWKCVILWHLQELGVMRFNEILRRLGEISPKSLTTQLRELEDDELVVREAFAQVPVRVEYRLSARGATLKPILEALRLWGDSNMDLFVQSREM